MRSLRTLIARAAVVIAVIAAGAAFARWYVLSNRLPALGTYAVKRGNVVMSLDEPGVVAAEDKAGLSFQEAGQVARVYVKEGDTVRAGAPLAQLKSASLEASVEQTNAVLAAAQAKLDGLRAGPTPQAIAVSQAALAVAGQTLQNSYAAVQNTLADAYAKGNDAVTSQTASFFGDAQTTSPQLTFPISDSQLAIDIAAQRVRAGEDLAAWAAEIGALPKDPSDQSGFDAALAKADGHLDAIQTLLTSAVSAVADNINLTTAAASTYRAAAAAGLAETNAAIAAVRTLEHAIASQKAAVGQAQAQLDLASSGATPQDIEAQTAVVKQASAAVTAARVALDNAALAAPFSGTVQNLALHAGQVVLTGQPVLTLVNNGGTKVQTYVAETDVAKIKDGGAAQMTLDALGTGTAFAAAITTIDGVETVVNGTPSYLVTLHFAAPDQRVKDGMTGHVSLILAEDDNVIVVPSRLVLNDGAKHLVLVQTAAGIERREVGLGLTGGDGLTEITSGLNENDVIVNY